MNSFLKRTTAIILLVLATLFSTACNTVEGAGRDIERGGEEIQDLAD